jgi:hypothetical protein
LEVGSSPSILLSPSKIQYVWRDKINKKKIKRRILRKCKREIETNE